MNYFSIDCPNCDDEFFLPAIEADQDCDFDIVESQICDLILYPTGSILPDWMDRQSFCDSIDNNSEDNTKGRWLVGEGGVAVPEKDILQLPKGVEIINKRTYSLTFTIKNVSDLMYDFLRHLQCGDTDFVFFFKTIGGRLLGSNVGIIPRSIDVDFPLGEGREDTESAIITITWRSKTDPDRISEFSDGTKVSQFDFSQCNEGIDDFIPLWSTEDNEVWSTEDNEGYRINNE